MVYKLRINRTNKFILLFFFLLLLIYVVVQFKLQRQGDDLILFNLFRNRSSDFLSVYKNFVGFGGWSSRFILDFLVFATAKYEFFWGVWQFFNPFFIPIFFLSLVNLSNVKSFRYIFFCFSLSLIFPYITVNSAGWAATTVSYLWPTSLLFTCLSLIVHYHHNPKDITIFNKICFFVSLVIVIDNELCCLFLTILVFVNFSFEWKKIIKNAFVCIISFVVILRFVFHAVWRALSGRYASEVYSWFPNFNDLTFIDKILSGFSNFISLSFVREPFCALILAFILIISVFKFSNNKLDRFITSFPFVFIFLFGLSKNALFMKVFNSIQWEYGFINFENYFHTRPYIYLYLFSILFLAIPYTFFILLDLKKAITLAIIFVIAALTKISMGLSPTVVASSDRTGSVIFMACIFLSAFLYTKLFERKTYDNSFFDLICAFAFLLGINQITNLIANI